MVVQFKFCSLNTIWDQSINFFVLYFGYGVQRHFVLDQQSELDFIGLVH